MTGIPVAVNPPQHTHTQPGNDAEFIRWFTTPDGWDFEVDAGVFLSRTDTHWYIRRQGTTVRLDREVWNECQA